ncbi:MAG: hypothetical protein ACOYJU_03245, partial [Anaerovoracaceae bacterium]
VNYSYMLMLDRKTNEQSACSLEKILVIFLWILGPTPTFDIEPRKLAGVNLTGISGTKEDTRYSFFISALR